MEPSLPSGSGHKRRRPTDEIADVESLIENPTAEKRVRFPKGKKAKHGDTPIHIGGAQDGEVGPVDARAAAKEREMRRRQQKIELYGDAGDRDGAAAEVNYVGEEYDGFAGDGEVPIDPFNLNQEREEGYFDDQGNFVEYVEKDNVKDAWLDSVAAGGVKLYTPKPKAVDAGEAVEPEEEHIGKIKRRIADVLEEGETVLQALRRLKGNSKDNKKVKMSEETKRVFDQLTEDAMTLLDKHGEYDVNQEKKEIFEREAQGYESLERARNAMLTGDGDGFDMFGEDDDNAAAEQPVDGNGNGGGVESVQVESDYVFDEPSGYYYSSSLGYYYDPATGLYCSAASGVWYSYNEETGAYDEVPQHDQPAAAAETVVN